MFANEEVSEPRPPEDPDSPLCYTMEGFQGKVPSAANPFYWAPGWNSAQAINKFQIEVGGSLHDGDPGKRLIEPSGETSDYLDAVPEAFEPAERLIAIPLHHIFGSGEWAMRSPALAERSPEPFFIMNPENAAQRDLEQGEKIIVTSGESRWEFTLLLQESWPAGSIGICTGFPGNAPVPSGEEVDIKKAKGS